MKTTAYSQARVESSAGYIGMPSTRESVEKAGLCALRSLGCLLLVSVVTWAGFSALHVNALIIGFAYVLLVLVIAARLGLIESIVTSIGAMLCLNYFFLPPILSLTIVDPQNWVALFAFFVTAATASQLSATVRKRAAEAQARQVEVERLYQLSLSLMLIDTSKDLGRQLVTAVKDRFGFTTVAFCDASTGECCVSGPNEPRLDADMMRTATSVSASWLVSRKRTENPGIESAVVPVVIGGQVLGSLGVVGGALSEPALQAISNLTAVAIEHAHQQIALGRLEVARQNERLRGILLDALAHDFLTPLTSIKGAISTVRTEYEHRNEEDEFLAVVEEETDRLCEMINETTDMARIEPGKLRIRRREITVSDLIQPTVNRMRNVLKDHAVKIDIHENIAPLSADPEMLGLALRQLLGNASKYSPPHTAIEIAAYESKDSVTVQVRDYGPGIPTAEFSAIFERFYRGKHSQESVAGTGMGLSIARDIINAHHGRLWVENAPGGGALFSFRLPLSHEILRP